MVRETEECHLLINRPGNEKADSKGTGFLVAGAGLEPTTFGL